MAESTESSSPRGYELTITRTFDAPLSLVFEIWRQRELFLAAGGRPPSQRLVATVLFVDMKGYTASAEKLDPGTLMAWVNDFMEPMAELVVRHGGVVDDYFGDGIKACFGVPIPRGSAEEIAADARHAAACAFGSGRHGEKDRRAAIVAEYTGPKPSAQPRRVRPGIVGGAKRADRLVDEWDEGHLVKRERDREDLHDPRCH